MTSASDVAAPVKEGEILAAKYRVEKVIGVGGMGVVVAATHIDLDERVALKFLLPQAAQSEELVGRFLREARSSVKLKGRHVAKVLDVGRMEDGRAYIVMEYLEGRDLGAELKDHDEPFPTEDAVGWMLQACEGLAEAHALGIVHRDLKPGNLFLTHAPDGSMLVKVLDFGISKSLNPNSNDGLSLTKTEMLLGSPLYMAPEQMRSSKHVDERSDIWALGAIAFELFARRVPFEADTLLDLCFKVAQENCPDLHELRPDLPEDLCRAVMRCLEKEASARYHDVGELAEALEPFAADSDKGSARRTVAILAGGGSGRPRQPSAAKLDGDSKRISKGGSKSGSKRTGDGDAVVVSADPLATGTEATARVASPSSPDIDPTADDGAADAVPASSAWGTTNARPLDGKKKGRVGMIAGASVLALGAAAFLLSRGAPPAEPPLTAAKNAPSVTTEPPASSPPPAAETALQPAAAVSPTAPPSAAPVAPTQTVAPVRAIAKPKASASASAASPTPPKPNSDFIRERE